MVTNAKKPDTDQPSSRYIDRLTDLERRHDKLAYEVFDSKAPTPYWTTNKRIAHVGFGVAGVFLSPLFLIWGINDGTPTSHPIVLMYIIFWLAGFFGSVASIFMGCVEDD